MREEYGALIQYIQMNKENDNDWFILESDREGKMYVVYMASCIVRNGCRIAPVEYHLGASEAEVVWGSRLGCCFPLAPPRWTGKCWYYYNQLKDEFDLEFEVRGWVGWIVGCNPC